MELLLKKTEKKKKALEKVSDVLLKDLLLNIAIAKAMLAKTQMGS